MRVCSFSPKWYKTAPFYGLENFQWGKHLNLVFRIENCPDKYEVEKTTKLKEFKSFLCKKRLPPSLGEKLFLVFEKFNLQNIYRPLKTFIFFSRPAFHLCACIFASLFHQNFCASKKTTLLIFNQIVSKEIPATHLHACSFSPNWYKTTPFYISIGEGVFEYLHFRNLD